MARVALPAERVRSQQGNGVQKALSRWLFAGRPRQAR